jgi:hypothetical protein
MATTAKRKQLIEKAERISKGVEITLREEKYGSDLLRALNYYNVSNDDKDKKKWFIKYMAARDKSLAVAMLKIDDYHFRHAGIIARLLEGGSYIAEKELNFLEERVKFLTAQVNVRQKSQDKADAKVAATPNVVSIQQRMEEKAHELAGEIEGAIDDFCLNKTSDFSTKNYLLANNVPGAIAKRIGEFYVKLAAELREAYEGKCPQLKEGYSHFTKRELKKFAEFVDGIIADCNQQVQTAKVNRAPRKTKPVNPTKLVARLKFMREFTELGLRSVNPTTIVDSSEVWLYNTKTRRISVYRGSPLTVKGTSIVGFDLASSTQMTVRKPEEFFKGMAFGKRALTTALKTIKTKASTPNGRLNEDTVILGAF